MRRGLAAALAAVMVITAVPSAATAQESHFASRGEVVQLLMEAADDYNPQIKKTDIIKGYGDGKLHEEDAVTRAQAVIMLNRAFGGFPELKGNNLRLAIPKETFTDIPAWAEEEVAPAFEAGIVAGTGEGLFSPDHKVTTEQMRLFIQRVYAIYGTNPKDSFYSSVNKKALDTLQIPEGSNITGTAYAVRDRANQQVLGLIGEISGSTPEKDTPETSENQGVSTPGSHGSDATSVSNSPKTGDNTNIAIFVLALAVSAGCLGTVVTVKRKRK